MPNETREEPPRAEREERPADTNTTVVNTPLAQPARGGSGSGWFVAGIIVVLLIIGGFYFFYSGTDAGSPGTGTQPAQTTESSGASGGGTSSGSDTTGSATTDGGASTGSGSDGGSSQ